MTLLSHSAKFLSSPKSQFMQAALLLASILPVSAATIVNGSFENLSSSYVNVASTDTMSGAAADGWSMSSGSPDWYLGAPGPSGLWLTPWGDFFTVGAAEGSGYREGISQTITGLTMGESYTISFQQANGLRFDQGSHLGVGNTGGWEVFIDGGSIGSSLSLNDNSVPSGSFPDSWNSGSVTFQAGDTFQTLEFLAFGGSASNPTFQFLDNVTVAAVPEPTAMFLCSTGIIGFFGRRKR